MRETQTTQTTPRQALAAFQRRWWLVALVVVLAAVLALARYVRAASRTPYVSSQTIMVEALPPEGGGSDAVAAAQALADQSALALANGHTITMLPFLSSVAAQVDADHPQIAARFGANDAAPLAALSGRALAGAFTTTHDGDRVVLTARWSSPAGAWVLARTAGEALSASPALVTLLDHIATPNGATLRILREGPPSNPVRDPVSVAAARDALAATLALGLLAALGLVLAADAWLAGRRDPSAAPSSTDAAITSARSSI